MTLEQNVYQTYVRWPYLDEETAAFVGDFENLWPGESINPQLVLIYHQATGANAQHYIHSIQILTEREKKEQEKKKIIKKIIIINK